MHCAQEIRIFWERGYIVHSVSFREKRYGLLTFSCCGMFDQILMKTRTPILQVFTSFNSPAPLLEEFKSVSNISGI